MASILAKNDSGAIGWKTESGGSSLYWHSYRFYFSRPYYTIGENSTVTIEGLFNTATAETSIDGVFTLFTNKYGSREWFINGKTYNSSMAIIGHFYSFFLDKESAYREVSYVNLTNNTITTEQGNLTAAYFAWQSSKVVQLV